MNYRNSITSLLILTLLSASLLSSCGGSTAKPAETSTAAAQTETETAAETTIYDDLPKADLAGYNFRILNNISNFAYTAMGFEEQTGETLDDAIYERNSRVEDTLNCTLTIQDEEWEANKKLLENTVLAGEDAYDVYFNEVHFQAQHALKGYLSDMSGISTISYDKPWWNMTATESLMIGDSIYFLYGDLHLMYYECYFPVAFNKNILNDYNLGDPYELVDSGAWTIDKMSEYMAAASSDLNGDGKMNADDQFGLGIYSHNTLGFLISCGVTLIDRDGDNLPYWNGVTEKVQTVYDTVSQKIFGDKSTYMTGETSGVAKLENGVHTMFHDGKLLFYVEPLGSLKKFRDVDFEIGVVPMPKYDESQDGYRSYIFHGAAAMAIPKTNTDLERTGTVVDNLAAFSHDTVRSAYFDVTLDFKYIQDEKSQDMLDILFSNGRCELSRVYAWGDFAENAASSMLGGKTDLSTLAAKYDTKIAASLDETLAFFSEN